MYYHKPQGKILKHFETDMYSVTVVEVQEQRIINNPVPDPSIPRIDCSPQRNRPVSQPVQQSPQTQGSYGRAYTKYIQSDGMNFGVSISSDMDL